ncbi:MAG: type II toxin-antitoxin system VapC family toxin [Armatimonadia bacterium]
MAIYALDTNHVSALLRNHPSVTEQFDSHECDAFVIATPILGELYAGAFGGSRTAQNLFKLDLLLVQTRVMSFSRRHAERYGIILSYLRKTGRPIPPVDAQLAAIAMAEDLTVVTADKHFTYIPDLKVENWLD